MNNAMLKGVSVVVVDPDRDTREMLSVALSTEGARVVTVSSVQEALVTLEWYSATVIISELKMPYQDGFDLVRLLNSQKRCTQGSLIPAIALTTLSKEENDQKARLAGFQGYLTKPVNLTHLYNTIATFAWEFSGVEQLS